MQTTIGDASISAVGVSLKTDHGTRSKREFDRTVFGRLLWKDWRVVRQVVVAIAAIMPMLQLLFVLLAETGPREAFYGPTVLIAMLAPTLIALGCSGMLIGHERQTGTWGWASTLPISWRSALISKLIVTYCACISVFCICAVIPLVIFTLGRLPSFSSEFVLIPVVVFLVWFEIIAFFYLALLLFREPMVALIVGAIAVSTAQLIVIGVLTRASADFLLWTGLVENRETADRLLMFSLGALFFVVGTVCMVWAFRWRWSYGQSSSLVAWIRRPQSEAAKATEYPIRNHISPTELWSQFVLSFQQVLGLRLLVMAGLVPAVSWLNRFELRDMINAVLFQVVGIVGATTFAGDQSLGRFRFLADRGVSPSKLVTTRLIVAMGFVVVGLAACRLGMSIGSPRFGLELAGIASPAVLLLAFSIGALGSLCFRRPIIAVTVTVIVLGFCGSALLGLYKDVRIGMSFGMLRAEMLYKLCGAFGLGCACVLITAIYKIANRWVVQDRVNLGLRYVAAFPLAILVSVLALLHFGFLLQPSYDLKQFPLVTLEYDLRKIPEIRDQRNLFKAIDIDGWTQATAPRHGQIFNSSTSPHSDAYALIVQSIKEKEATREKWLEQSKADLSKLDDRISWTSSSVIDLHKQIWNWNPLLAKLAIAGRLASAEGEFELSKQAWQRAKQLLDVNSDYLYPFTQAGRSMVWWALSDLTDSEIAGLGGPHVVRDLCPKLTPEANQFWQTSHIHTILTLSAINGELPSHESGKTLFDGRERPWYILYPPVKWFIQRTVAADYHNRMSPGSFIPKVGYPAIVYQDRAGEFLARLDRLQVAADQSDQSDL